MSTIINVQNLTKVYDKRTVVDHINFEVKKAEFLSILGPNGAGKSTTINILCTLIKPEEGTATIYEHDILKDRQQIRELIGVTPQEMVFYPDLSARENLIFFAQMGNIPKKDAVKNAEIILKDLGLGDRYDKVKNFSGGMKRRLNLAINIILDSEIFFLDEVTTGIDPQSRHLVWDLLIKLKKRGKTIILTTHSMEEAELLSDRVIIIDNGKIIAMGSPDELKMQYGEKTLCEFTFKNLGTGYNLDIDKENSPEKAVEAINIQDIPIHPRIQHLKDIMSKNPLIKGITLEDNRKMTIFFEKGLVNFIKILQQSEAIDLEFVESINLRQTTLEDVFLKLTGRRLRE
jgi:ABC-2 type transport system ATP-binding protein